MGFDTEKADQKGRELQTLIANSLSTAGISDADRLAGEIVNQFARITAPYWEQPLSHLITTSAGGIGGGSTIKPGNIVLNIRSLVRAIASGTLTIAGAMAEPWTLVIGALVTWDALWSCLRLDISEEHACLIWAMWTNRDENNTIAKSDLLEAVNRERSQFGKPRMSQQEVDYALHDLLRMKCLKQSRNDPERWWLQEWVRVKY